MRKLAISLALSSAALGAGVAFAAPFGDTKANQCGGAAETGCFIDDVLVINGEDQGADGPLVFCEGADPKTATCNLGKDRVEYLSPAAIQRAARKAAEVAGTKVPGGKWDEIVVFTADFGTPGKDAMGVEPKQAGPLFYREQTAMQAFINEVGGIGFPTTVMRDKAHVGHISAGTTKNLSGTVDNAFGRAFGAGANGNFNRACDESPNSLCFKDIYNYYDALAQATAAIYGPYLPGLTWLPLAKTTFVNPPPAGMGTTPATPKTGFDGLALNVWNSLINTGGSLLGGNTWRDKGNGTWEVARPTAFQGVSAPFENSQVLRFMPLDLYLMGFVPSSEVKQIGSFREAKEASIYAPAASAGAYSAAVGPGMGVKISGVALRATPGTLKPDSCNGAMPGPDCILPSGARVPDAGGGAPQAIKQLWVVVTKPKADWAAQKTEIANAAKARRWFQQYFYNLTQYRGRLITTADGVDDSGYFEFGDQADDMALFEGKGGSLEVPGLQEIPNSGGRAITVGRVNGTGLGTKGTSLRILGSADLPLANNVATVRLRLPNNPGQQTTGTLSFTCASGNIDYTVPNGDGTLLADGKFHNYSVALTSKDNWTAANCTGVSFTLSEKSDSLEVDFIKVGNASASNLADADKECDGKTEKTDGWLALEDNCPKVYNPGQEDGNGDGVGDACEDFDGDNVVNSCDNCPTVTNSSQRDANNNKQGDACDGSTADTCFFTGSTVAGTSNKPGSASIFGGLAVFGMMVVGAVRRRRRR